MNPFGVVKKIKSKLEDFPKLSWSLEYMLEGACMFPGGNGIYYFPVRGIDKEEKFTGEEGAIRFTIWHYFRKIHQFNITNTDHLTDEETVEMIFAELNDPKNLKRIIENKDLILE